MAQLVERSAVNRQVLGSIPSGGVDLFLFATFFFPTFLSSGPINEIKIARD